MKSSTPRQKKINTGFFKPLLFLVLIESIFITSTYFVIQKQVKAEAKVNLEEIAATIHTELNHSFETTELLKDLYMVYGEVFLKDFNKICNELTKDNIAIGSMYFAPKGIIKYAFPDEVDSSTANFNMLQDPIQGPKAQKALDDQKPTIAGPHDLIEGGKGFIIRTPVFKDDEFKGFTIIVVDSELLMSQIITHLRNKNFNFVVWKEPDPTASLDEDGYILKSLVDVDKIKTEVQQSFEILNDTWYVAIEPIGGWHIWSTMQNTVLASLIAFLALLILILLHGQAMSRNRQLQMEIFANNAKSSFLFNMSHDIRTPMNAIIGFADLMRKNINNKEKLSDYLDKLHASSNFLLSLINNVLEMSRIESGKIALEETVFSTQSFEDVTDAVFTDLAHDKGLTYSNKYHLIHDYVMGDETKIRELTLNIISNAIKYTPTGGFVKLQLIETECSKPGYTMFTAICEDSGIGISEEYLPHIFDEFSRERNSTDSQIAGTGLGMPIVKKLLDLMDGDIEIESQVGKGTKVTIHLPLRLPTPEQVEATKLVEAQNAGTEPVTETFSEEQVECFKDKQILLAEDNDLNAEIAIAILDEMGFVVQRVANGQECLDMLVQQPAGSFNLILMDIQMPVMNGYETVSAIRKLEDESKRDIPVIAMTANAFNEDRIRAIESGMNDHVAKPISIAQLTKALSKVLK